MKKLNTFAPAFKKPFAISKPIPLAAPVTIATFDCIDPP